jgi:hypothetical protein
MRKILILLLFVSSVVSAQIGRYPFSVARAAAASSYPDVLDDGDTELWLEATDDTYLTLDGSAVTTWEDRSSNGWDLTQAEAGYRPAYSAGNGVVFAQGGQDALKNSSVAVSNPYMVYMLIREDDFTAGYDILDLYQNATTSVLQQYASVDRLSYNSGGATIGTEADDQEIDTWFIVRIAVVDDDSYIQIDAHDQRTGDYGTATVDDVILGSESSASCGFSIIALILRAGEDTGTDLSDIYDYLVTLIP